MPIVLDTLAGETGGGGKSLFLYRNVSHYYWIPSVTASQEYSYLEDQTKRSKGTLVFKPLTV